MVYRSQTSLGTTRQGAGSINQSIKTTRETWTSENLNDRASSSAALRLSSIVLRNRSNAAFTLRGGPASSISRVGGRSNNTSSMEVARESITYKCSHQSSSLIPVMPAGGARAQSTVTPVRMVCPCEAVEVNNFSCVPGKPMRRTVCTSELRHVKVASMGG